MALRRPEAGPRLLLLLLASWGCVADASGSPQPQSPQLGLCSWPVTPRTVPLELPPGPHRFPAHLQLAMEVEGEGLLLDLAQNRELMMPGSGLTYYLPNGTRTVHPTDPEEG
ncbi:hypothetical protein E2320_022371 [Naja naja]|nr:hypothetical protein E2320_022371 [Naja naja]